MTVRLKGKEKLKIILRALPAQARKYVAAAVAEGADDIVAMQKHLCPVGEAIGDEHPGQLRDSIGWKTAAQDPGKGKRGRRVADPELAAVISAGGAAAPHALYVEFGTEKMRAEPFFRPGVRVVRKSALRRINAAVRRGVREIG